METSTFAWMPGHGFLMDQNLGSKLTGTAKLEEGAIKG